MVGSDNETYTVAIEEEASARVLSRCLRLSSASSLDWAAVVNLSAASAVVTDLTYSRGRGIFPRPMFRSAIEFEKLERLWKNGRHRLFIKELQHGYQKRPFRNAGRSDT